MLRDVAGEDEREERGADLNLLDVDARGQVVLHVEVDGRVDLKRKETERMIS